MKILCNVLDFLSVFAVIVLAYVLALSVCYAVALAVCTVINVFAGYEIFGVFSIAFLAVCLFFIGGMKHGN